MSSDFQEVKTRYGAINTSFSYVEMSSDFQEVKTHQMTLLVYQALCVEMSSDFQEVKTPQTWFGSRHS